MTSNIGRWLGLCVLSLVVAIALTGCGDKPKTSAKGDSAKATAAKGPAPKAPAAKAAPTPAKPAAAEKSKGAAAAKASKASPPPAAATATAAPPAKREDSISLRFSKPGSDSFVMPGAREKTVLSVTPVDKDGRPIRTLKSLGRGKLLVVAATRDMSWVKLLASDKGDDLGAHRFTLKFTKPGAHTLLIVFHPEGGEEVRLPTFVTVRGKIRPDEKPGGAQLAWRGPKRIRGTLEGAEGLDTCDVGILRAKFKQRRKPLAVASKANGPAVRYLLIPPDARTMSWLPPAEDGLAATLQMKSPGSYAVFALATVAERELAAQFFVVVGGEAKPSCPAPTSSPQP